MYQTSTVARLAGAVSLPVFLACWGFLYLLASGETTVNTWAIGLASMFPISAILITLACNRSPPRTGIEYAIGLVGGVVILSVTYVGLVVADYSLMRAVARFNSLELLAAAIIFALLGGILAFVDARYIERPITAAMLEERYLDEPIVKD